MGTFQHILKPTNGSETPRNWCYFDVEAKIDKDPSGEETHTCKLGWACYHRLASGNKPSREIWFTFSTAGDFWDRLIQVSENDRKLVVIGYNVGYDFRLVDGFNMLAEVGYKQERLYCKAHVVVMSFVKDKHNILVLDAMNYFNGKLASWGEMLGVPKGKVDFNTVTDKELSKYCKQDVLILKKLMESWLTFIAVNQFGSFAVTRASQSMIAYRRKYMKRNICIHGDKDANELERLSYYGGRTECFFIGTPPGKKFWKVDINSMYPYIMANFPVPYNLRGVRINVSLKATQKLLESKGLIATVDLQTDIPAFPLKYNDRICFPIGKYTTTLAGEELALAFEYKAITKVRKLAIYDKAIRFRGFVTDLYGLRLAYKEQGNKIYAEMVKYLMNSLYGKFGQYNETMEECKDMQGLPAGEHLYCDIDTGKQFRVVSIAGQVWKISERTESINSFPAISSFITSAARVLLWRLILKAGRDNVFYTDTDSLIVNHRGYKALTEEIDPNELGKLKLEYTTKSLILRCPKDYTTDVETHIKGITDKAIKLTDNSFAQTQWQGLRGAIAKGITDRVSLRPVTKVLKRKYNKGIVQETGVVLPYSFS